MDVESNKTIGRCLRRERAARELRQTDVAKALGRPQSFVSKLETGERALASSELFSYARALGMSAQELLADVEGALTLRASSDDEAKDGLAPDSSDAPSAPDTSKEG